ncbi:MAG: biopolymer transporter ExbD [Gammaproteobacteria bacterium]|nr:MAG: biopolymer transporter ExbD [Gammaproteobacteria bacterium]
MRRHNRRGAQAASLNLVSLMDIFTILVFFLLVNSGEIDALPNAKIVKLPVSIAEEKPRETLVILVTDEAIFLQGKKVTLLDQIQLNGSVAVSSLTEALTKTALQIWGEQSKGPREVTIMATRQLPYALLKRIVRSCSQAHFSKISLAAVQKSSKIQ